ncbi:MAG: tandem-95 repeat protein [Candidatus Thiodiazotropha sp. (ex Lucinoma borealis)]|nr:tandem-95 repeat protein [Candidatus Thiodiazotropha sp. (ex Lucinoma borealis)]
MNRSKKRNPLIFEELEPRLLLSADLAGIAVDLTPSDTDHQPDVSDLQAIEQTLQSDQALVEVTDPDLTSLELVIIDPSTPDYQSLVDDLISQSGDGRSFEIVLLDTDSSGIEQISETLSQYTDLDAVHLISHGSDGEIHLGDATIDFDEVQYNGEAINAWGSAFSTEGDLLIYGCDLAATIEGERLVDSLAQLTGADVAASDDLTGHDTLGGDWELEYSSGKIETDIALSATLQTAYKETLDITTGLQGHWTFDADATDASGNNYDGTLTNGAAIDTTDATDRVGEGKLSLDGNNDYVDLSSYTGNFSNYTQGTIATWVNTSSNFTDALFSINDTSTDFSRVALGIDNGELFFLVEDGAYLLDVQTSISINDGTWHHVAVTVDGSGNRLYIDGEEVAGADLTYFAGSSSSTAFMDDVHDGTDLNAMYVGITERSSGFYGQFGGLLDDMRVYDRALSASDIAELATNAVVTAVNDSLNTAQDTPVIFDPTTNDTDEEAESISVVEFTQPANGAVVDNGNGTLTYTPNASYTGADSFDYVAIDSGSGLTHYWGLDSNASDAIGTADGTLNGTTPITSDFGNGLNFNETSDYVLLPDVTYGTDFTVSFEFKVDDNTGTLFQYLYSHGDINSTNSLNIFFNEASHGTDPNVMRTVIRDADDTLDNAALEFDASAIIGDSQWHTYTLTVSASGGSRVYLDGVLQNTDTRGSGTFNPTGDLYLGIRQDSDPNRMYGGALDSVQIYDTSLSSSQITDLEAKVNVATVNINVTPANVAPTDIVFDNESIAEQPVNTYGTSDQIDPAISAFDDGGYVVVWVSNGQDGSGYGIYGQRYNADGSSNGVEFLVASEASDSETNPSVTTFSDGGFVVTWQDQTSGVMAWTDARVFNADGTAATSEFQVSTGVDGDNEGYQPSVLALNGTEFVVVWANETGGVTYEIAGQIYDRTGSTVGSQFTVGSLLGAGGLFGAQTEVTLLEDGGFAAVWRTNDGSLGTRFAVMNSDGSIRNAETTISGADNIADIASLSNGNFVVTYDSGGSLKATIYDANGTVNVSEFNVNTTTSAARYESTVTRSDDGFVVVWESSAGDGSGSAILAQRFDTSGNKIDGEVVVNETTTGNQQKPEVIETASGKVVAVWQSENVDAALTGIVSKVVATGSASINENAADGTRVADVIGVYDLNTADTHTFSLTDDGGGRFAIDANTGVITVANGSLLDYETNTSHDVTVRVTDSGSLSHDEVLTININNQGGEPTQSLPGAQNVDEDGTLTFSSGNGNAVTVSDTSGTDASLQVTLTTTNGILTLSQTNGLSIPGGSNGSSHMVLQGLESDINAALEGMIFTPSGDFNGAANVSVTTAQASQLAGYYSFDAGTAIDDSVGISQNGSLVGNATTVTDGTRGEVLSLDGSGDYVLINDLYSNPADVTLSAWVNFTTAPVNGGEVISIGNDIALRVDDFVQGVTGFFWDGSTYQFIGSGTSLSDGNWHHLAFSFNDTANTQNLYIDGTLVASANFTSSITYTGWFPQSTIGAHADLGDSSFDYNGLIDDARIYDRALSADEIATLAVDQTSVTGSVGITVNSVNDAPVLDNSGFLTLTSISEDETNNSGNTIAEIIASDGGDRITDIDAGALEGIAILSVDNSNGTWEYNTGSGWTAVGSVSGTNSLLLRATDSMRFVPDGQDADMGFVTFCAWDQTSGTAGTKVDTSVFGGTTAFSVGGEAASITVTAVNDDPIVVNLDGDVHNYTEGDGIVLLEQGSDAVVSDVDSANFNGGSLTVEVDSGLQVSEDVFSIRNEGTNAGQIGVSGSDVTYGGAVIGTYTGGTGLNPLTVNLNTNATPAAVTALVQNITYENSNIENPTSGSRSVVIDITDGDGGACPTQNLILNVSSVNDAPVVDLNGADGVGVDFVTTFTEDAGAVNVADVDATISDVDSSAYENLSINLVNFLDGASERIVVAGYTFTYGVSDTVIRTVGSTSFELDFDGTGFNVMLDGGGGMPAADLQTLLRGVTYENTSQNPTAGDRAINIFAQDSSILSGPTATSTITVNPQNDAPTATNNANSVSENGFVSGNVITDDSGSGVDSDPEGDGLQVTQVEGGAYTPGFPVTLASGAQVTFQSNGSYTYNTNGQFDGLGAGSSVDDSFTYQISDDNGGFDTATVTVTINGSNDAPSITSAGLTLDEGETVTLSDANFAVTDADDTAFTYTVSGISGGYFQLSSAAGTPITSFTSADLTGGLVQFVDNGDEVAPVFSVTVNDGDSDSNTLAATINYTPVNDSLMLVTNSPLTVPEGGTRTITNSYLAVSDVDNSAVQLTYTLTSLPSSGSLRLSGSTLSLSDTFTQDDIDNNRLTFRFSDDASATSFAFTVSDGTDIIGPITFSVNGQPVNDAPVNLVPASCSVNENVTLNFTGGNQIQISDIDHNGGTMQVQLNVGAGGLLTLGDTTGLIFSAGDGADDANMIFTGILADINAALLTLSFTPTTDFNGDVNFTIITNDQGNSGTDPGLTGDATSEQDSDTFTITVNPVNDAPVLDSASLALSEGQTVTLSGANFGITDPDDSSFTYTLSGVTGGYFQLSSNPGNSISSFNSTQLVANTVQFVDDGNEVAPAFSVTVNDGDTDSNTLAASISFTLVSDSTPVANADSISVAEGGTATTLNGGFSTVLNNDTGLDDTPVIVSLVTDVTNGTLSLNGDGTFSYTHDGSENFTDSFTYRITDNDGEMADATVSINVTPVSDATPVAVADTITVAEGATITTLVGGSNTVLNNDTGLSDTPVTVSLITGPTQSSAFTLNADGTFSYTHNGTENFTDSFIYRITDNDGQTADATVAINVTPVSDATPVAVADTITVAEGATITTLNGGSNTVLNNDTGLGDTPVTVSLITGPTQSAAFSLNADGTFSYTHNGSENFSDSFTYRVTDNDGQTADATVTINITPVSDATPVAVADTISVAEGGTATSLVGGATDVLSNDTGLGDTPVTVSLVTSPTQSAVFTLNADGTFSYTHNGSENLSDSFTYRVTDNDGQTSDATVNIDVTSINSPPEASNVSINVLEDTIYTGNLPIYSDGDGDDVTYQLESNSAHGSVLVNGDGSFSYAPDTDYYGTDSFTYSISDGNGGNNSYAVSINVGAVNDSPVITSHSGNGNVMLAIEENTSVVTRVTADDLDNDTISFAIDDGTDLGLFNIDSVSGELMFVNAPDAENPLDSDQDNVYQVQVVVSDGNGGMDRQSFTIEVTDVDEFDVGLLMDMEDDPDIISLSTEVDNAVGIVAYAEDLDITNNRVTYTLDEDANGLFAIDPSSGVVTLTSITKPQDFSQFDITVRATSDDGSYSLKSFSVAISRVVDEIPEPEVPHLDEIIFDLGPTEPHDPPISDVSNPEQQVIAPTAVDATFESIEKTEEDLQPEREIQVRAIIETERNVIDRFSTALFGSERHNKSQFDYHQARLTPVPVAPNELPIFNTVSSELIEVPASIWNLLDSMNQEMSDHQGQQASDDGLIFQSAAFSTLALSAGYVTWLLRAGVLSASFLSFTPLWRQIDPLPVLSAHAKRRDDDQDDIPDDDPDEKRLAKLFDRKNKQKKQTPFRQR